MLAVYLGNPSTWKVEAGGFPLEVQKNVPLTSEEIRDDTRFWSQMDITMVWEHQCKVS